ncbi:hypothetical protein [Devosia sp. SD17-2]|uniref:hypothetical protein n=1 Tax=Devosia sp. SD17-2 TaxID=2976459 RepID=UPI0023D82C3E|nr:hypothetical protein [Devosia sp. SD17-2]WEJ35108.1 hypothetical protein NYQ88_10100 [Devosia sp. SD17-2]
MPSCRLLVLLIRSVLSSTSLSTCHFSITASHLLTSRIPRSFAQSLHVVSEPAGHEVARLSRPDPGSSRPGIGLGSGRHKPFKQIRLNADQVAVADDIVTTAAHRLADFRMTVETSDDRKAIDAAISGLDDLSTALRSGDTSFLAGNRRAAMKMIKLTIIDEGKWPTILDMATPGTEAHARATQAAADKEAAEDAAMERLAALQKEFEYLSDPVTNFYTSDRDRALHEAYPDESYGLQRAFGISAAPGLCLASCCPPEPANEPKKTTEADLVMIDAAEAKRARRAAKKMKWSVK